ncbi:Ig-like domain-containing protein [Virgibacillus proomii]|uniref:Ig-like domain-containing protein n=1 Tax=Virgibacillus proomii TaxID=84407 RepID=UPI0009878DED|nr:Ig-like domain-containing protein [Virgibacillus proomii]
MVTYNVYRDGSKVASGLKEKTYTDEGLTPNTQYQYQVSAENLVGESELSDLVTLTTNYSEPQSIDVSPKTNNLNVGGLKNLTAKVSPDTAKQTVTWSSTDDKIATIDTNGKVSAVSKGQVTITATSTDKGDVKGTATVNVKQPVTGVTISPKSAEIEVGSTQQLTATIAPDNADNKKVTYSTSDDTIAVVNSSGLVTSKKEGQATITVTTEDGIKTDTAAITVVPKPEEGA